MHVPVQRLTNLSILYYISHNSVVKRSYLGSNQVDEQIESHKEELD